MPARPRRPPPTTLAAAALLGVAAVVIVLPGCSLFVMGGKMLFGDPATTPAFEEVTGVDLTDGGRPVLILADSPESVKIRFPELDQELVRLTGRKLRAEGVKVVRSDEVLDWVEARGGVWDEATLPDIAQEFDDVDFIVTVALDRFTWHEHASPDLLKGRAAGRIRAYEVIRPAADPLAEVAELVDLSDDTEAPDARPICSCVMPGDFSTEYPKHGPEQAGNISERLFRKKFLDRLCTQTAQRFVPHHARDTL